jgi:hypothetical protein
MSRRGRERPAELPHCALRVTKYDPALRVGGRGAFTGDDWTSVSDVGRTFDGVVLTLGYGSTPHVRPGSP